MRHASILLVEDLKSSAFLTAARLHSIREIDALVDTADSVEKAKEKISQNDYDLIILDLGLPDSSGIYTFNQLQVLAPHTPIVVLTMNDDRETKRQIYDAGAFAYLVKEQITDVDLSDAVLTALRVPMDKNTKPYCPIDPTDACPAPKQNTASRMRFTIGFVVALGAAAASVTGTTMAVEGHFQTKAESKRDKQEILTALYFSEKRRLDARFIELNAIKNRTETQQILFDLTNVQLQDVIISINKLDPR